MIELAAAMVGDVDPVDPVIERDLRILGGGDTFDHQRYPELVLDQFDRAPIQPLLETAAGRPDPAFAHIALGDVALAPAVMRGVDRETKGGIAAGDRAADPVLDKGIV